MKPANSDPTRWSCRLVRTWRSMLGKADENALGSRHVASCADCQRFFAAATGLEAALRRDARQNPFAPAGLDERILREIDRSAQPVRPRHVRPAMLAIAGAAAAAAVAFGLWQKTNSSVPEENGAAGHGAVVVRDEPTTSQPWTALKPSVDALMRQDPLRTEVDSVYADARSAVHFLALNFLPAPAVPSHDGKTSPGNPAAGG